MCGIAGIVELDLTRRPDEAAVLAMCHAMEYRGPDDRGVVTHHNATLGMQRLSIIDLASGHQPIANEDHTIWTVLNGEIYNYRELRNQLAAKDHQFRTLSDTEVLVHGYEEYGADVTRLLDGMFAFAIWDGNQRCLLLARDPIGIKPLYYYADESRLVFASELLPILDHGVSGQTFSVDPAALNLYLAFGNVPAPYTLFGKIRKLLPGSCLELRQTQLDVRPYWRVLLPEDRNPVGDAELTQDAVERYEAVLGRSVRSHLVADVPVGAFLSGGIDSSTVAAVAAQHSPDRIHTFSIGFADANYDESRFAKVVSESIGSEHHEFILSDSEIRDNLHAIMGSFDEPFSDSSGIPTFFLSKYAREKVKVILSGDGGDELFNGYNHHRVVAERYSAAKGKANPLVHRISRWGYCLCDPHGIGTPILPHAEPFLQMGLFARSNAMPYWHYYLSESYARVPTRFRVMILGGWECLREEQQLFTHLGITDCPYDAYQALAHFDLANYLPNDILTKVDRMSMKNSLEVRVPLLCKEMVDFAFGLPHEMKIRAGEQKYVMREYLRQRLFPREISQLIMRPKHGFRAPVGAIMDKLEPGVRTALLEDRAFHSALGLSVSGIDALFQARAHQRISGKTIWTLYCLYLWWARNLVGRSFGQRNN